MKQYFLLQFNMIRRHIDDFGVKPIIGLLLLPLVFVGVSDYVFVKSEYVPYVYAVLSLLLASRKSETSRNDFLKLCFTEKEYRQVRLLENVMVVIPFVLFLLIKGSYWIALGLPVMSGLMALFNFNSKWNVTVPTPFFKRPFEFVIGFRKYFLAFFLVYVLAGISMVVGNFELGIITLVLNFFFCMGFYSESENEYHAWIFALSPGRFLLRKMSTAFLFSGMLALPVLVGLVVVFPEKTYTFLGFSALGIAFLMATVLGKYSSFPRNFGIPQAVLIAVSLFFPPVILAVAVFFYFQSIKKLNRIL